MNKVAEELYGKDAKEWLSRWDAGETLWSVEMGGLGDDYEEAIQAAAVVMLRAMLDLKLDASKWSGPESWKADLKNLDEATEEYMKKAGLSGAMYSAALSLAGILYKQGPAVAFSDKEILPRLIVLCDGKIVHPDEDTDAGKD